MKHIELPEELLTKLEQVEGTDWAGKVVTLLVQRVLLQLRDCEDRILKYMTTYQMDFSEFEEAWKNGRIANKHAHKVERDLMEWEGLVLERKRWLAMLRDLEPRHDRSGV